MHVDLEGPAGRLEALIDVPAGTPVAAAVVAHPHPQYGGTLQSRVVHEIAKGLARAGAAVLRFNFRGVGRSTGAYDGGPGELADFRAALEAQARRYPGLPLWAGGYSFGAWVAMTMGATDPRVTALVGVAPLVEHYDFTVLVDSPTPKFFIVAEDDALCRPSAVRRFYARVTEPKELVLVEGAGHGFDGRAAEVGDLVEGLIGQREAGG